MSRMKWTMFTVCMLLAIIAAGSQNLAQQGKGKGKGPGLQPWRKGGKGDARLPQLAIEDLKPDGVYEVVNLLPRPGEQSRIGLTDKIAYRLVSYEPELNALKFAVVDLAGGTLSAKDVRLPADSPRFVGTPSMATDGGTHAVVSQQAATVFVDVASGRARVAAGFDSNAAMPSAAPPRRERPREWERHREPQPTSGYRIHGGANGAHALSVLLNWDNGAKSYRGNGATLHSASGRSVSLSWSHDRYGVPPRDRDAVFAVTGDEIIVLTTSPKTADGAHELHCLVFDASGALKNVQTAEGEWHGSNAARYALSPCGGYVLAQPAREGFASHVMARGTWERKYRTDYTDACVGFAPEGGVGVFIENLSPQRAALKAIKLASGEATWTTSLPHAEVEGLGDARPFSAVGAGATAVATRHGIIAGKDAEHAEFLYTAKVADFEPLSISYDSAGKLVAVLALDRVFVIDARTRTEVHSIALETPLPAGSLGEFITFDSRSRKLLACARSHGVWLIDLASNSIEKKLPPVAGTWARALPDLSGVIYSSPATEGGNVMLQKLDAEAPERLYRCEYRDAQAVCLWVADRGNEFLITERNVGEGKLFLVNEKGDKILTYNVADVDTTYVGDNAIAAFVTRRKQAVLINEVSRWGYTGINCTVIGSGAGDAVESMFTAVFRTEDLPGRSTYGTTAASPFFGGLHFGDERMARFACPAGVLEADISRGAFRLFAWSRSPQGLAAVNPKAREFFVAGSTGLTTYRLR